MTSPQNVLTNQQVASQPQSLSQSRKIDDGCTAEFPTWSSGLACNGPDVFVKIKTGNVTACCLRNPNAPSAGTNTGAPKPRIGIRAQQAPNQNVSIAIPPLPGISSGRTQTEMNSGEPNQATASGAGSCVSYFLRMRDQLLINAAICAKETRFLQSLTDSVEVGARGDGIGDPAFTHASAPELFGAIKDIDVGWTKYDNLFSPKCTVPLGVYAQSESFSECARVYLCGAEAAKCGVRKASQTNADLCVPISQACLAEHPVPQRNPAPDAPPVTQTPTINEVQLPRLPSPYSGISGPSSSGRGTKSQGGVSNAN